MDVGQIGPGGVNRNSGRPQNVDPQKPSAQAPHVTDQASISPGGREYLAAIDALSEKLKHEDGGREARVREVREKLQSGELDNQETYRAVAEAILDSEA